MVILVHTDALFIALRVATGYVGIYTPKPVTVLYTCGTINISFEIAMTS